MHIFPESVFGATDGTLFLAGELRRFSSPELCSGENDGEIARTFVIREK
jgi:hypothetical protein